MLTGSAIALLRAPTSSAKQNHHQLAAKLILVSADQLATADAICVEYGWLRSGFAGRAFTT